MSGDLEFVHAPIALAAVSFVLALFCSACASTPSRSPACATVEIAEIASPDEPGARQLHTADRTSVSLAPHSLITTSDISAARPAIAEGHRVLETDLGPASAARLRAFTASHVGTRLAFVVNGSVRNIARILDPISGQGLIVDPVSREEATALAQCLEARA